MTDRTDRTLRIYQCYIINCMNPERTRTRIEAPDEQSAIDEMRSLIADQVGQRVADTAHICVAHLSLVAMAAPLDGRDR